MISLMREGVYNATVHDLGRMTVATEAAQSARFVTSAFYSMFRLPRYFKFTQAVITQNSELESNELPDPYDTYFDDPEAYILHSNIIEQEATQEDLDNTEDLNALFCNLTSSTLVLARHSSNTTNFEFVSKRDSSKGVARTSRFQYNSDQI